MSLTQARLTGIIGVLSAAAMVVADLVMLLAPPRGTTPPIAHYAASVSRERLLVGDYLGLLALPFVLVGLLHVYWALRQAGAWRAFPPVALLAYTYVIGGAFHHGAASLVRAVQEGTGSESLLVAQLLRPLLGVFTLTACAGALLLFLVIVEGRTAYPRWVAWFSPLVTFLVSTLAQRLGPPCVATVLLPAGHNLAMLLFLAGSTVVLWRRPAA
jgi:hypothetical protein